MLIHPSSFPLLCRSRDLLLEEADSPRTVREVAEELGVSQFHLIRQFEAVFGLTPAQYRIQARLANAKALLASGRDVTDVCMRIGFSSLGSFSSLFTRRVGESPSAYRRRVRVVVPVSGLRRSPLEPGCLTLMGELPISAFRNSGEARTGRVATLAGVQPSTKR